MESMKPEQAEERWSDLLFAVRRSIRYHVRRRQFFDRFKFFTGFFSVISGGGTVVSVLSSTPTSSKTVLIVIFGSLVGILSAIDLVVGCSNASREHHDLARAFSDLEKDMVSAEANPTREHLIGFSNRRIEIEKNERPKLGILDAQCHNELVRAYGHEDGQAVKIMWYQGVFAHFIDIFPSKLRKTGGR
jgi:hypothetical protein